MDNFMHKSVNLTKQVSLFNAGLEKSHVKPIYQMTYEQARLFLEKLQADSHQNIDADIEDKAVYTENSGTVDLRIVRPKNLQDNILPVILYIHGGGWVMGGKNTHDMLIRKLALATSSVVVFPEYSLSPEAKFPIALYQCYDVLKYLYSFPDEFNIDNKKIVIAGDSAGGNMTASIALMSKYSSGPHISFQILLYPVTDLDMSAKSYQEFENGPWLTKKAMEWFINAYISDKSVKNDIYASPLKAPLDKLVGMPPALVITAQNDVLRDEGELFADKLINAGVDVLSVRINSTQHDFLMLNALQNTPQFDGCMSIIKNCLDKAFN